MISLPISTKINRSNEHTRTNQRHFKERFPHPKCFNRRRVYTEDVCFEDVVFTFIGNVWSHILTRWMSFGSTTAQLVGWVSISFAGCTSSSPTCLRRPFEDDFTVSFFLLFIHRALDFFLLFTIVPPPPPPISHFFCSCLENVSSAGGIDRIDHPASIFLEIIDKRIEDFSLIFVQGSNRRTATRSGRLRRRENSWSSWRTNRNCWRWSRDWRQVLRSLHRFFK